MPSKDGKDQQLSAIEIAAEAEMGRSDPTIKSSNDPKDQQVTAVATETEIESGKANASQRKLSWKEWTVWEFVALLISAAMMVGLVVFLRVYDGKPVPSWSRHFKDSDLPWVKASRVTFNAVLSVFSKATALVLGFAM